MTAIWIATAALVCAGPVYPLDNGVIRVEVEPRLFAVRFAGFQDKPNFVAPLTVDAAAAEGKDWLDAGGLQTDLVPYAGKDAATRRGPAEVVEYRSDYIAMLGPPSESSGIRLKKEIQLDEGAARAHYRVTAQRVGTGSATMALRNTVRLAAKSTVRLERTDGEVRALAGGDAVQGVVKSRRYWLIPIPPTRSLHGVILGTFGPRMIIANDAGTWTRTLIDPPKVKADVPNESTFMCVLDSATGSYGASLQGAHAELKQGEIMTSEEVWEFEKRGR